MPISTEVIVGRTGAASAPTPAPPAAPTGPVRGVGVSHRPWKTVQSKKASLTNRPKVLSDVSSGRAYAAAQAIKRSQAKGREVQARLAAERLAERTRVRQKRADKQKRRAENQAKAGKFQAITDGRKLAKMSKKQLRSVKKLRVDAHGNTELVPAFGR